MERPTATTAFREDGPFSLVTIVHGGAYGRWADQLLLHYCVVHCSAAASRPKAALRALGRAWGQVGRGLPRDPCATPLPLDVWRGWLYLPGPGGPATAHAKRVFSPRAGAH
ncbi:hypothetical protein GCM10010404_70490 [Nonomuraea africana]